MTDRTQDERDAHWLRMLADDEDCDFVPSERSRLRNIGERLTALIAKNDALVAALRGYDAALKKLSEHFAELELPRDIAYALADARQKTLEALAKHGEGL